MATTITLGTVPQVLKVILVEHADFVASMRRSDGQSWPDGASLSLQFTLKEGGPTIWEASFASAVASWDVDRDVVDALVASKPRAVRLWYEEGELQALWAQGEIDVRGT